ncbi:MAG TPA: hypothetical protein VOA80_20075 [Thermoanaerobaculia bacterium]|nr:hypothetical protein [Thermoanaerobaculia bacterium]
MSDTVSLAHRIVDSDAFASLRREQRIHERFHALGWSSINGAYYRDAQSEKYREIDVLASRMWKRTYRYTEQLVRVRMVVEAKSIKGFHLLLGGHVSSDMGYDHRFWPGNDYPLHERLRQALVKNDLLEVQVRWAMNQLEKLAFPGDSASVSRLLIPPPPAPRSASTFRETNIHGTKELDSSVLWRASQSLSSAVKALKEELRDYHLGWMTAPLECSPKPLEGPPKGEDVADLRNSFRRQLGMVDIFHPIAVVEAHLWMPVGSSVERVPSCRFLQLGSLGTPTWWVDIVDYEALPQFLKATTNYYAVSLRSVRAKPVT